MHKPMRRHAGLKKAGGFSLLELMIVVIVISVLAAIANASYQQSVVSTRRGAAKACLMEASQFMERYYTTANLTYVGGDTAWTGCTEGANVNNHYTVQFNGGVTATTYTLQAVPQGAQASRDTKCGTLGINQAGTRTETGTGSLNECW